MISGFISLGIRRITVDRTLSIEGLHSTPETTNIIHYYNTYMLNM